MSKRDELLECVSEEQFRLALVDSLMTKNSDTRVKISDGQVAILTDMCKKNQLFRYHELNK